ncbi:M20 family metallopeptidase [Patulibacter sp. S7RM1-6]
MTPALTADPPTVDAIRAAVDAGAERTIAFLQELVRCPSVNPWFGEPDEISREARVQDVFQARLEALGASEIDRWEPDAEALAHRKDGPGYYAGRDFTDRPNLVARIPGTDPLAPAMLVLGHCDVVSPGEGWTTDPFGGARRDGAVYGRGTVDMKGGMACAIGALEALRDAGVALRGDVLVASVVDEEAGGMGVLAFADRGYAAEAGAIVPEATQLNVAPLCRGILWGEVEIAGRAGHIELPQPAPEAGGAVDAIALGRRLLDAIEERNRAWAADPAKNHPLLPLPCEIKVAQLQAGTYPTTYAESCRITFNAQYLPAERDEHGLGSLVKAELEELFRTFAPDDAWLAAHPPTVTWLVDADCGETPADAAVVAATHAAALAAGAPSRLEGVTAHTDMGLVVDSGIPTINFGPGHMGVAHQPDEHVSEEDLRCCTLAMALAIRELVG